MKRVGIVEFVMSAGGVERVLRGLARAFLEIPEAREWDITFLLSRYNSAQHRCEWPVELTGPNVHVEWLGEEHVASRVLDRAIAGQGAWRVPILRSFASVAAHTIRRRAPAPLRAIVGDRAALIERASERFDVLYFTYPVGIEAPRALQSPVVATPQDFNYLHFHKEGTWLRKLLEGTTVSWMERADCLLLSSDAVGSELREVYPKFAPKARVVRLGIEVDGRTASPTEIESVRRAHALPTEFLLVPGWVAPHKNQLVLVEATRRLLERGISIPIVFVGPHTGALAPPEKAPSEYAERVKVALRDAGMVAGRDYFALGYVSDQEIRCLYRLATMCVIASLYEGFGLPALEAKQAGCPTLLAAIPPFEEQNRLLGDVGRTFDPRNPNALADLIANVLGRRAKEMAAARDQAARVTQVYDWKKTARAYLEAFDEVVENARRNELRSA